MIVRQPTRHSLVASRSGFTLLEVLVVTAILVILAGVATFGVVRYLEESKRKVCKLQMQKIENACKAYYTSNQAWPQSAQELIQGSEGLPPLLEGGPSAITDPWGGPFQIQEVTDNFGAPRVLVTSTGSGTTITWPEK